MNTVAFTDVDPASEVAITALNAYFAELNALFPGGFDPGDALTTGLDSFRPPTGSFIVGLGPNGELIGCGALQGLDANDVEIKRMWIAPDARGLGLGKQLLDHLERTARNLGYRRALLDTNDTLTPAISLYERSGYTPTPPYNDNPYARLWFEKPLG